MTFLTRTNKELHKDRHELAVLVNSHKPSVVITVGNGGTRLCDVMDIYELCDNSIVWGEIIVKHGEYKTWLVKILKLIPVKWKRYLRFVYGILPNPQKHNRYWRKYLDCKTVACLSETNDNVVIIDDAIDEGTTIQEIKKYLITNLLVDENRIKVVTYNDIHGDKTESCIYNKCTVIFPWALDFE